MERQGGEKDGATHVRQGLNASIRFQGIAVFLRSCYLRKFSQDELFDLRVSDPFDNWLGDRIIVTAEGFAFLMGFSFHHLV